MHTAITKNLSVIYTKSFYLFQINYYDIGYKIQGLNLWTFTMNGFLENYYLIGKPKSGCMRYIKKIGRAD